MQIQKKEKGRRAFEQLQGLSTFPASPAANWRLVGSPAHCTSNQKSARHRGRGLFAGSPTPTERENPGQGP